MLPIPATIEALVAVARAALTDVQVIDGPPVTNIEPDVLCIGFSPEGVSVEGAVTPSALGGDSDEYEQTITCVASSWRGDNDVKVVRDRVCAMVAAFEDAIAADRSLGEVVTEARLGPAVAFDEAQASDGASASVEFSVTVRGWL